MNILVVTSEPPDPFGNPAGRWYYVLAKGLSERGHRVRWLAAYTAQALATRARACLSHPNLELRLYPYPTRSWLPGKWETLRRPYGYFISRDLAHDLDVELRCGYDILHLEPTWAGYLGIGVPRSLLSIQWLARIDLARPISRDLKSLASRALMKHTERHIIGRFNTIRALTPRDGQVIRGLNSKATIVTIPLALDPDLYSFKAVEPAQPVVGLIGSMVWSPGYLAAVRLLTSIWPRVKARVRDARLLIAGWGARQSLGRFLDQSDVTILEDVPDIEPVFRQLSVLAYPAPDSSGMKVKVLEAMAYGAPIVTTSVGMEGIDAINGVHALIANEDEEFAEMVITLLKDKEARQEMRLAGRRLVEEKYSPGPVLPRIEALYERVIQSGV